MFEVRCSKFVVLVLVIHVQCPKSDVHVRSPKSDVRCSMFDVLVHVIHVQCSMSDVLCTCSKFEVRSSKSEVRCPKYDVRRFTPEGTPATAWVPSPYN